MEQLTLVLVIFSASAVAQGLQGAKSMPPPPPCRNDTDCAPDQCCYIKPLFEVVSKRAANTPITLALLPTPPQPSDIGVCEDYGVVGDVCSQMAVMNGHCGCAPGLSCGGSVFQRHPGSKYGRGIIPTLYPGQDLTQRCGSTTPQRNDAFNTLVLPPKRKPTYQADDDFMFSSGTCEDYKHTGDGCNWLEKQNGHCGCRAGLSCKWVPLGIPPTIAGARQRRGPDINHMGPGSYQCL